MHFGQFLFFIYLQISHRFAFHRGLQGKCSSLVHTRILGKRELKEIGTWERWEEGKTDSQKEREIIFNLTPL